MTGGGDPAPESATRPAERARTSPASATPPARREPASKTLSRLGTVSAVLASYGLCRLIFNAVGLRLLGTEVVGRVNIALSMAVLVSLPVSAGVAPVISRYLPLVPAEGSRASLRRWGLRAGALGMLLPAIVFLLVYGWILHFPYGAAFAPIVVAWAALYSLYNLCRAEQFAREAAARALLLEAASVALFAAGIAVLMVAVHSEAAAHELAPRVGQIGVTGAPGGVWEWLPFSVYYLPAALWIASRTLGSRANARVPVPLGEMRAFALYSFLGSVASLGVAYFTTIVVSASLGLASAGLWATLLSAAAPLLLAPRTLNSSFFPRLSLLGRTNPDAFARLCHAHQRFASLFALGAVGAALALSGPILAIAVGRSAVGDSGGDLLVSWWFVCVACYGLFRGEPITTACGALGRARLTAAAAFVGASVCAMLWGLLLPRAGMPGVAVGYMAFTLVVPLIVLVASRLRGPAPPSFLFPSDAAFAIVAALAVVFGLGASITGRIVLMAIVVAALAHGLIRIRRDLHSPSLETDAGVEPAPSL